MSDLFHKDVPLEFIQEVFSVIEKTPWHTYQILTKRSDRLKELAPKLIWHENIWMGVSVETQDYVNRIADLVTVPAKIRFLSCEPLLGPLYLPLYGIHWVIVGGESGAGSRDMAYQWAISIRDQCYVAGVPFFFKQWGGRTPKAGGCLLEGEEIKEFPEQNLKNKPQQAKLEPTNQPMQLNLF
jgi:protein gp37